MRLLQKAACLLMLGCPAFASILGINSGDSSLYSISTTTAVATFIGNTGIVDDAWADIAFASDGTLYGFTDSTTTPTLYRINPATAAVTAIGPLGLGFVFEGSLAFGPDGTAYGTNGDNSSNPQLFRVNLATGAATVIATISGAGGHDINGMIYRAADNKLIGIDRVTNSLLLIDPVTAIASTLAAIPATVGGIGGLTESGGVGFYVTAGPGATSPGSNELYSFDLTTGASTLVGSLAPTITGAGLAGIAGAPEATGAPEPVTFMLTGAALGALLLKRRG